MAVYGRYAQRMLAESGGLRLSASEPDVHGALQARLDDLLGHLETVQLLDAGCGKHCAVPVARDCHVVGVDVSEEQLARNPAIDEAIVGDLQTCQLGQSRFDAVICWNVLEHLDDPNKALMNFKSALKPGGVIVIGVPHVLSVKGLVTRLTPLWFHGWVWRHLLDGTPPSERFPTVMSRSISPKRLREFARANGFAVELLREYEGWPQKKLRGRLGLTGRAFRAIQTLVGMLSLGSVTCAATDVVVVLRNDR